MHMDWNTIVIALIAAIVLPLLKYGLDTLKEYLEAQIDKIDDDKFREYIQEAIRTVSKVVLYVMQTYVDTLKAKGEFDKDAQKQAFNMAKLRAETLINASIQKAVAAEYGDFSTWLETQIETCVREYKKEG